MIKKLMGLFGRKNKKSTFNLPPNIGRDKWGRFVYVDAGLAEQER